VHRWAKHISQHFGHATPGPLPAVTAPGSARTPAALSASGTFTAFTIIAPVTCKDGACELDPHSPVGSKGKHNLRV
jgi:hypothetical protein